MKVPGLCVGGGGIDPINATHQVGYVCFLRAGVADIEKHRFRYYRKEILIPFFQSLRKTYDNWNGEYPIPTEMTAVSWCDGEYSQLSTIVDED